MCGVIAGAFKFIVWCGCCVLWVRGRGGTGTRLGAQGGDRGGVPLGFFPWAGDSELVSLTPTEIIVFGFGVDEC